MIPASVWQNEELTDIIDNLKPEASNLKVSLKNIGTTPDLRNRVLSSYVGDGYTKKLTGLGSFTPWRLTLDDEYKSILFIDFSANT